MLTYLLSLFIHFLPYLNAPDKIYHALNDHKFNEDRTVTYLTKITKTNPLKQQQQRGIRKAAAVKNKENANVVIVVEIEVPARKGKTRALEEKARKWPSISRWKNQERVKRKPL